MAQVFIVKVKRHWSIHVYGRTGRDQPSLEMEEKYSRLFNDSPNKVTWTYYRLDTHL